MGGRDMLKFGSLTAAAAVVLSVSGAQADGKYSPEYNWVGLYVGGTLGYGLGSSETYFNNCNPGKPCGAFPDGDHPWTSNDPSGALAGLTLGYNYRLNEKWLAGIEADISVADIKGKDGMYWGDNHKWNTGWNSLVTLRGRAGWEYDPRTLIYGTAGVAAVNSQEYNVGDQTAPTTDQSSDNTGWKWGWVAGAGVERAFSDRWTGKIEYLHVGLADNEGHGLKNQGKSTYTYVNDLDIVRVGVNYKLD
jgi:outer membrane immunogenic protein